MNVAGAESRVVLVLKAHRDDRLCIVRVIMRLMELSAFNLCLLHCRVLVYVSSDKHSNRMIHVPAVLASHKMLQQSVGAGRWRKFLALLIQHIV